MWRLGLSIHRTVEGDSSLVEMLRIARKSMSKIGEIDPRLDRSEVIFIPLSFMKYSKAHPGR